MLPINTTKFGIYFSLLYEHTHLTNNNSRLNAIFEMICMKVKAIKTGLNRCQYHFNFFRTYDNFFNELQKAVKYLSN